MNASELSEQIRQHVEAGEWSQAMASLSGAWTEASEFGTAVCDLPEFSGVWVRFATRGYPWSLRRTWIETNQYDEIFAILLSRVIAWNVPDENDNPVILPTLEERHAELMDNVEVAVNAWLVRAFGNFILFELIKPRKN